jgi:arylsulfatase A-like enzyme
MTGLYASKTGLQDLPIIPGESRQLPLHFKTTGNIIKELDPNTETYLVGKWHLGNKHLNQLPLARGYDHFFGVLGGAVDHYNRTIGQRCGSPDNNYSSIFASNCKFWNGYDLLENNSPYLDLETYSSDLFGLKAMDLINSHDLHKPMVLHLHFTAPHTPLQAPLHYLNLCENVSPGPAEAYQNYYRQIICGMVLSVDLNLLRVLLTLYSRDMLSSTLLLFHSDNGGYQQAGSLNIPFRGQKGTSFEGGVHVPAFIYGSALNLPSVTTTKTHFKDLIHVSDVLPTLLGYLGADTRNSTFISSFHFDGMNHWNEIISQTSLQRKEIHVDSTSHHMAYSCSYLRTITLGHQNTSTTSVGDGGSTSDGDVDSVTYKYHFNPSVITFLFVRQKITEEYEFEGEYLFNLSEDPSEQINLIPLIYQQQGQGQGQGQHRHRLLLILELMRQEVLKSREASHPSLLTGMPPVYDFPPSPLGCWLPLDSPHYETFDCGIKPNFNLPKLPSTVRFLFSFDSLPKITEQEQEQQVIV